MLNLLPKFSRSYPRFVLLFILITLIWTGLPVIAQADSAPVPSTSNSSIKPYLNRASDRVTEFKLDNGMKFIVMENHDAPVVSFFTYADVGGANEPDGKTGVAHFLEHLAFKGTSKIGTTNYQKEETLLDKLDVVAGKLHQAEKQKDQATTKALAKEFEQLQAEAGQYVKRNEFGQIVEQSGGVGINAATSTDSTVYFYSFPSNKLELWMSLESERFLEPVFREFHKEQEVILEERRMRTDNSPIGLMVEAFLDKAYDVHPYKRPTIGYDQDIRNLTRKDIADFFQQYYGPSNLTIAIVGDVDPKEVKRLAQEYFGRFPKKAVPAKLTKVEPKQTKTKEVTLKLNSQPWYLEGYHRPALNSPDNAVYEVISTIMSDGRTARLYKSLVEEKQVALVAEGENGFPGDKYPNLMLFYAQTAPKATVDQAEQALRQEIERLKTEPVSQEELERAKNQLQASLLRSLDSNMGMARLLTEYQVKTGDWRNLFNQLEAIAAVTPADIQRVAQETFTPENRTIGRILSDGSPK